VIMLVKCYIVVIVIMLVKCYIVVIVIMLVKCYISSNGSKILPLKRNFFVSFDIIFFKCL